MSLISFLNPDAIADNSIELTKIKTDGKVLSEENYTKAEKDKLAGITAGANKYVLPVASTGAIGGVKSGTDITVDGSGNVSVNDDSHNHVISNVDGLQTALDGKAALSHVHVIGQVTDLQSKLDAKANAVDVYTKSEVDDIASRNKGLVTELATSGNGYNVKLDWSLDTSRESAVNPTYRGQVNLGANCITSGPWAHTSGIGNIASGNTSLAVGKYSIASGRQSFAAIGDWVAFLNLTGDAGVTVYTCNIADIISDDPDYLSYVVGPNYYSYIISVGSKLIRPVKIISIDISAGIIKVESTLSANTALNNVTCSIGSSIALGSYSFAARGVSAGSSAWTVNRGGFAKGNNSFVGGNCNSAYNDSEVAFGHFNKSVESSDTALAPIATIGIGSDKNHRKNATEIMQNGDAYLIGIGGYDGTNAVSATSIQDALATKEYVENTFASAIATADAMIYKGTIGTGGTVTSLPSTTAKTGWTYKVITAGSYAGQTCEVGDMIVCLTDGSSSVAATWTVIQTNIDGAVIGPANVSDGQVAIFNGVSGKSIKAVDASKLTVGTASKTANSLSLKVGSTTKTFNGSSAVTATLSNNSIEIPVPKVYETSTSTNTTSIPASTHGCGTKPIVQCYEDGAVVVCAISIDSHGNVTVEFNGTHTVTVRILGMDTQTLSDFIKLT